MVASALIEQSTYFFSAESQRLLSRKVRALNPEDGVAFFPAFAGFISPLRTTSQNL
jgi:hypothetical protein